MIALPRLDIAETMSPFDEAVLTIDGDDAYTITIECNGALELAEKLARLVNHQAQVVAALEAAANALRSYEYGNSAPDLAHDIAAHCDSIRKDLAA